jgi:hypothetical protein
MAEEISGTNKDLGGADKFEDWASAFAYLESQGKGAPEAASDDGQPAEGGADPDAGEADGQDASASEHGDVQQDEVPAGGLGDTSGADLGEGESGGGSAFETVDTAGSSVEQYEEDLKSRIRDQSIREIAEEFVKRGFRNNNGALGANINDPDICKRDSDGVPRFYNPETGREFSGDNPRRQAQEWCDDYNRDLADKFNRACSMYEKHLMEQEAPKLAVMKFKPKYEKLDDIRRDMFDNIIEDYEVRDGNDRLIGYSCDLDKALDLVNRQIAAIQNYAKQHKPKQEEEDRPSGPVLDMPHSGGTSGSGRDVPIRSLEDALLAVQERELSKLKKG